MRFVLLGKVNGDSPRLSFVLICESVADDG